jgi:uncharacterized membrane protein (UPF0127 family)
MSNVAIRGRRAWAVALISMLALAAGDVALPQSAPEPLSAFPRSLLAIRTAAHQVINFKVWLADTPQRDEQGLMFVKSMDEHEGMLFVFAQHDEPVRMWMKNTFIPLDMLFMDAKGRVDYIKVNATPLSEAIISAPRPEYAVLELNGGAAERLGIRPGDTVVHSAFKNAR